jgi:hypothetical protein
MIRSALIALSFVFAVPVFARDIQCELTLDNSEKLKVVFRTAEQTTYLGIYESALLPLSVDDFIAQLNSAEASKELSSAQIVSASSTGESEIMRESKTGMPISILRGKHTIVYKAGGISRALQTDISAMLKSSNGILDKASVFTGTARLLTVLNVDGKNVTAGAQRIQLVPISCINYTDFDLKTLKLGNR